jgi:tRNA nucleotidyltransferase (CCA-adding enzyme)
LELLENLCSRLKAPNDYKRLAEKVMRYHGHCHRARELRASTLVDLLQRLDALRKNDHLDRFLTACEADAKGRPGHEDKPYPQADRIRRAQRAALSVTADGLLAKGLRGKALGRELRQLRIKAVRDCSSQ